MPRARLVHWFVLRTIAAIAAAAALLPTMSLPAGFDGATPTARTSPAPPTQPATGPGGMDYAYDRVVATEHGEGAGGYVLFEPADPPGGGTPVAPAPLPIVLFLSACCEADDLNDVPFAQMGGLGRAHQLFGDRLTALLEELNGSLAA